MITESIKCDVLIIGCGGAGIRAAIEAHDAGADVIIINKTKAGYSGSTFYPLSMPWGIMTAGNNEKDQADFYNDILEASCGCLNKKLTEVLVRESYDRYLELCNYGIKFRALSDNNEKPCFGNRPRGAQLISVDNARNCLFQQLKHRNIRIIDNLYVFDILVHENTCFGALGTDDTDNIKVILSKTTIMATGGAENLWQYNLVTSDVAGDGYAMAVRHGAWLMNMEFIQFIPGLVNPVAKINFHHPTLVSLPAVRNYKGDEFLDRYLPEEITVEKCVTERARHGPFSCEDSSKYFDIAICSEETNENNGVYGAELIYNDLFYNDEKHGLWREFLSSRGIDTKKESIRIYPHCQGFNGGIVIDENCSTDIENLYASGECAGGPHGANRIGGNAILATQVFGKIAGEQAAKKAFEIKYSGEKINYQKYLRQSFETGNDCTVTCDNVLDNIKKVMQRCGCIIREEEIIKEGLSILEQMHKN